MFPLIFLILPIWKTLENLNFFPLTDIMHMLKLFFSFKKSTNYPGFGVAHCSTPTLASFLFLDPRCVYLNIILKNESPTKHILVTLLNNENLSTKIKRMNMKSQNSRICGCDTMWRMTIKLSCSHIDNWIANCRMLHSLPQTITANNNIILNMHSICHSRSLGTCCGSGRSAIMILIYSEYGNNTAYCFPCNSTKALTNLMNDHPV